MCMLFFLAFVFVLEPKVLHSLLIRWGPENIFAKLNLLSCQCCFSLKGKYILGLLLSFWNISQNKQIVFSKLWLESFTMSKMDCHSLRQKVCQRISVIPENWHFYSCFVLKTTKNHCLFSLLRFFDKLFDVINNDPFFTL